MVVNTLKLIMRTRTNALLAMVLCSTVVLLNWVAMIIMSLVTLHKGEIEGAKLLGCMAMVAMLAYFLNGNHFILENLILVAIPIWVLSGVLRKTSSWSLILELLVFLGILGIVIIYSFFPEWLNNLINTLQTVIFEVVMKLKNDTSSNSNLLIRAYEILSNFFIGVIILLKLIEIVFLMMIARVIQAHLYNDGGFKKEFINLTISWVSNTCLIIALVGTLFDVSLTKAFLPIVFLPFIFVGMSVIHYLAGKRKNGKMILVFFYISFMLYSPAIILLLIITAIIEKQFNLRSLEHS
ncbi:MAG: hypothetical protein HRT87_02830 [Legionellales bacterium]|nr:hypothetical protein [Legionellales bacterium]